MSLDTTNKLNRLLQMDRAGKLFFSKSLNRMGYSDQLLNRYRQSGWLTSIAPGVMARKAGILNALSALSEINDNFEKTFTIAAHSALDIAGYTHFVPMGKPTLMVRRDVKDVVPKWLLDNEFDANLYFFTSTAFVVKESHMHDFGDFKLLVSSPEQAFLEALLLAPKYYTYMDLYYIMEQMTTLRIDVMQRLLEGLTNNKVKRMFLYMASKSGHYWYSKLNLDKIDLGEGKYNLSPGGVYLSEYKITVPNELNNYE